MSNSTKSDWFRNKPRRNKIKLIKLIVVACLVSLVILLSIQVKLCEDKVKVQEWYVVDDNGTIIIEEPAFIIEPDDNSDESLFIMERDWCTLAYVDCGNEIEQEIRKQAKDSDVRVEDAIKLANCESNMNPLADNPTSSASGLYQFIDSTWDNYCEGDVYNYEDNIRCFLKLYPQNPRWWNECIVLGL